MITEKYSEVMLMTERNVKLTSAEIASIWGAYINHTMDKCVLRYFLKDVEDVDIRIVIQHAYDLASENIEKITGIFKKEQLPLPIGFTDKDVNMNAPRLYSDSFMLEYIGNLTKTALMAYSGFIATSARKDVRTHFIEGLTKIAKLYDKGTDISLEKGLFVRPPFIPYPTKAEMVDSKKYFSGLNPFSDKRPLDAMEIGYLHMNIKTNQIGGKLALSFAQTSPLEEVQKWMLRGRDITNKHIGTFTKLLLKNDIQVPAASDIAITDSTISPFSEKLKVFLLTELCELGMGNYAIAAAASQRNDLFITYERLSLEIGRYAKSGADIMIKNEWFEQPPGTLDKDKLARNKSQTR